MPLSSSGTTRQRKFSTAIINGCTGQVSEYLAEGINPNDHHPEGLTPLALSWQNNDWLCAELLLNYGARINGTMTHDGMGDDNTLLHLVCAKRSADPAWISFLGEHRANPDAENSLGLTPMYYATSVFSARKIGALAAIGASGSRIYRNRPVLHMAAIKHSARLVTSLVDAGTSIDCRDEDGRTVLHYANLFRSYRVLDEVFGLGANPNALDIWSNTPLHTIVSTLIHHSLHPVFLDSFLTAGARLNTRNRDGETILHKLPWQKPSRARNWLERLLAAGVKVNIADRKGVTPLELAEQHQDRSLVNMLLAAGARKAEIKSQVAFQYNRQNLAISPIEDRTGQTHIGRVTI